MSGKRSIMTGTRSFGAVTLALVVLTLLIRLPALLHPEPIDDEAMYSVVANEILAGGHAYTDAVERKPPLIFWTYAAIFGVAGEFNWPALHASAVVWVLLTMAALCVIGRHLFDWETGMIAALLYSIFQPWGTWKNLAFNGEVLMNLPVVLAWMIALGPSRARHRPELLLAGALLCGAFLLKQPAAIAAVPLPFYFLLRDYRASRRLTPFDSMIQIGLLALGFVGVLALVVGVLYAQGALGEAVYWTIGDHDIPQIFWRRGVEHTLAFAGACLPILLGAAIALRDDKHWAGKHAERMAIVALLVVSAIGTAASGRFYPHYYIQLIPPLALLAAPSFRRLWAGTAAPPTWLLKPSTTWSWLAFTLVAFSFAHWHGLASQREPSEAGRYVLGHSSPEDRIFVWGQAAPIYLAAHRRPASRYITSFPLTGYIFGNSAPDVDTRSRIVPGAWADLATDFDRHPPAFIVDAQNDPGVRYRVEDFPLMTRLLAERYHPVARTADGEVYEMNGHAQHPTPAPR